MPADDANDITLASYEAAAEKYVAHSAQHGRRPTAFLDSFAMLTRGGTILEIGSGPGEDADYLERQGVRVRRSDATVAFVQMMIAAGHEASVLDVRTSELGGPYDGVIAQAVLLHLGRREFADVLGRLRRVVSPAGILGFTLKEGDGASWSDAKLDLPRHFTYWRAQDVTEVLARTQWDLVSLDLVDGRYERWINVIARAG